jgi:PAS domain S-box-containing protein
MANLAIALLELLVMTASVLALHRLRPRFGLAPLLAFLSGLVVLAQLANYAYPLVGVQTNAAVLMVAVVFMALLLLLAADGVVAAAQATAAVMGLSLLVLFAAFFIHLRRALLGPGSIVPIVAGQNVLDLNPRLIFNSIVSLYLAFHALIFVYRRLARRRPRWATGVAPGLALLAGLGADALVFHSLFDLHFDADFRARFLRDLATKSAVGLLLWPVVSLYLRRTVGTARPVEDSSWSLFDVLFGPVGRMESDLSHVRDALRAERDLLRRLAETSPVGILRFERDGRLSFANSKAGRVLGVAGERLLGRRDDEGPWSDSPAAADAADWSLFRQVRESGEAVEGARLRLRHPDGSEATLSVNAAPLLGPEREGDGLVATLDDVTRQHRAEVERDALIRELEQRNQELERFTYTVSHDLKSPLITLRGFLGHLQRAAREGRLDDFERDRERMVAATSRMEQLLGELLELSRSGRAVLTTEPVDLGGVVREALQLLDGRLGSRPHEIRVTSELEVVDGDRQRLLEVFLNLLENAIKFSADRDPPRIEIGRRPGPLTNSCFKIFVI